MNKPSLTATDNKPDTEASIKSSSANTEQLSTDLSAATAFDMADFDKRLEETQRETSRILRQSASPEKSTEMGHTDNFIIPDAVIPSPAALIIDTQKAPIESGLLARLAREAKENQDNKLSLDQDKQARASRVHTALERIFNYLTPFIQHVNNIEHKISRTYRLDARTAYANLQWQGATIDSRKLGLSESAQLAYVVLNINLASPEPVLIKRPWDQFEALKKELQHLRLNVLDDLHNLHKRPQQEWLQAQLDPVLQVQILFKGNYENGRIDIATRNIEELGSAAFKLAPEEISIELLDELGLFLIGRTDQLPVALQRK